MIVNFRTNRLIFFVMFFVALSSFSQINYTKTDSIIFIDYIDQFKNRSDLPIGDLVVHTALSFKDTPYVASTLDNDSKENLVVNLREFDCNTFVETCIALAKTVKSEDQTFDEFAKNLQQIRYRKGVIDDYASRLHYVSDWSFDNESKEILIDKSQLLGGRLEKKPINFMSLHFDKYKALRENRSQLDKIVSVENEMNDRNHFYVVPKCNIDMISSQIQDGDIIAFATNISGLDYSHIAIAYHLDGELRFIHASTRTMSVIVEPRSLSLYCKQLSKCTGISVFRLIN